jgi:hypothetical protein
VTPTNRATVPIEADGSLLVVSAGQHETRIVHLRVHVRLFVEATVTVPGGAHLAMNEEDMADVVGPGRPRILSAPADLAAGHTPAPVHGHGLSPIPRIHDIAEVEVVRVQSVGQDGATVVMILGIAGPDHQKISFTKKIS